MGVVKPSNLIELLRLKAQQIPDRRAFTFLSDGESAEIHMTYREFDQQARAIGAYLQEKEVAGKRAIALFPPSLELISAAWACQYAGMVMVFTYPPDPSRLAETLPQFLSTAKDSQASIILTTHSILSMVDPLFQLAPELKELQWIATDQVPLDAEKQWKQPQPTSESLAFLQYTSGSTGLPKGVMLSHKNILSQLVATCHVTEHSCNDLMVSWIPLYHNMGIGAVAQTIMTGSTLILMSPISFLESPLRWLKAISNYRAKISVGPNFAYELCVQHLKSEKVEFLDLSCWKYAICGAELIRAETIDRFVAAFAPYGFRRDAFTPGYGLTEATLLVSSGSRGSPPLIKIFRRTPLQENSVTETSLDEDGEKIVACGQPVLDQEVIIVNPETLIPCEEDQVGEIWVSGPCVAMGYLNQPKETEKTFKAYLATTSEGPFLRTGDLGFLKEGQLFVTGRLKDLIIMRGRNHYPQDIEQTVERSHPALRIGCGVAFSVIENEEKLVIVQEIQLEQINAEEVMGNIREMISKFHGIHAHAVVFVKPDCIPRTRNGKFQRYVCREKYLDGSLEVVSRSVLNEPDSFNLLRKTGKAPFVQPRTPLEEVLSEFFFKLLGHNHIGIDDNFFELGGNSLLATQLISRIRETFQIEVPLNRFFESPTVASLAVVLTENDTAPGKVHVVARLFKNIDRMSPEEINFLLENKK